MAASWRAGEKTDFFNLLLDLPLRLRYTSVS